MPNGIDMTEEWDRFKFVPVPGSSNELVAVRHVAHVPSARRIVEDQKIKAGLVYDASRLNKSRISVAWVSANTWGSGSIYGTVEFQFAWATIIAGRNIYWVEAMADYNPNAYRLLLTNRDDLPLGPIKRYDPIKDEGPLRVKDGKYYWNTTFTSEFMIEDDLRLGLCTGLDFIKHHDKYCRPFGFLCDDREKQPSPQRTGGRMLSFVLGNGLHVLDKLLKLPRATSFPQFDTAYQGLEGHLPAMVNLSGLISADDQCQDVLLGSLAPYGADQVDQARKLLALISSKDNFTKALRGIVRTHFGDPNGEPSPDF
jgi:hypothetical protein